MTTAEQEWQNRYHQDGFAVLRSIIPPDRVLAATLAYEVELRNAPTRIPDVDAPLLVMWYHAKGGFKRYTPLADVAAFAQLVSHPDILAAVARLCGDPVRLLETIVFNKPPGDGGALAWHQDASFYPLAGGVQVSALVMLDPATMSNGAVSFAIGSHRGDIMSAVDLHEGKSRPGDLRPAPKDPQAAGFEIVTPDLDPGDVVLFHSKVWHGSGPNLTPDKQRRLLSIRYISLDTRHQPVPGNAASFMHQIATPPGQPLSGGAFPILQATSRK